MSHSVIDNMKHSPVKQQLLRLVHDYNCGFRVNGISLVPTRYMVCRAMGPNAPARDRIRWNNLLNDMNPLFVEYTDVNNRVVLSLTELGVLVVNGEWDKAEALLCEGEGDYVG